MSMPKYSPRFSSFVWLGTPALLFAFATPFWDAKTSSEWTLDEVRTLLTDSPWAQTVDAGGNSPAPLVQVYIATAEPVQLAEDRIRAAAKVKSEDPSWADYRDYLLENTGKLIVFAIRVIDPKALSDAAEARHMEESE